MKMCSRCERLCVLVKEEKKRRRKKSKRDERRRGSGQQEGRAVTLAMALRSGGVRGNE